MASLVKDEKDPTASRAGSSTIAIIGLGYIGLPSAALFASAGFRVIGVDIDESTVVAVNSGSAHLVEPGLSQLVRSGVESGLLTAQAETPSADVYLIAVPTPVSDAGEADLHFVEQATDAIAKKLRGGELVVIESTCPPGTARAMRARMRAARPELPWSKDGGAVDVAHCPERVLPGKAMVELVENGRIVGGLTEKAALRAKALYATVCRGELRVTDAETAELAKLTENAFRDVNIAFANELSMVCHRLGVDVWQLIELANLHPRVNILQPGPGVGGHCIAVDPWFIVAAAPQEARLIRMAREVNDDKPRMIRGLIDEAIARASATRVAVLGLTFKPDIDDIRESPALDIVRSLAADHPELCIDIVEPHLPELPPDLQRANICQRRLEAAVADSAVVVLLVDHTVFRGLDRSLLRDKQIVDSRGVWR